MQATYQPTGEKMALELEKGQPYWIKNEKAWQVKSKLK